MITLALIFFPLIASILVFLSGNNNAKKVALLGGLVQFVLSLVALSKYQVDPSSLAVNQAWLTSLGVNFTVGIDGIGIVLVLLTSFLIPIIILSTFEREFKNAVAFYALILFMSSALIGVFVSYNLLLFYIFWEAALIPIYFIAGYWGGEDRVKVTFKFFLYTIIGSLFMLVGIIYVYLQARSFDYTTLSALELTCTQQGWLFWAFFIAFAIKMPIFPFHTWQPNTYTTAPAAGTMLLSGIMLKMGIFGVIRWLVPISKAAFLCNGDIVIVFAVIGIVYGAVLAIKQDDIKRLVAFSSISHVGLIAAGLFAANELSLQGSVIQMFAHGVNVVGIFFIVDLIERRTGTRSIKELGGIINQAPLLSVFFVIIMLGSVALPLTNGFVGEFLLLNGLFQYHAGLAAVAGLSIILGAVYMLKMYQNVMLGESNAVTANFAPLALSEIIVLTVISATVIIMGVYPQYFLDLSQADIHSLVSSHCSSASCIK